jgi:simple sugar transport system ATP-binding protein
MAPLLEARGLSRSFGHVRALDDASFDVEAGEVVALIGDNGGASTRNPLLALFKKERS